MDHNADILEQLEGDMACKILKCLDDPADLIRAAGVSHFWYHFAITNGLSKQLCVKKFPQLSNVECITEPNCGLTVVGSNGAVEWEHQKQEHNVYASLLQALNTLIPSPRDCIVTGISASSTDNYPDESIINTLNPRDRYINRGSYWSSKGQSDPAVPETLIYNLRANLCVVTEIRIQPFEAFFQPGNPIYSAKYVRFRMGHPKSINELENYFLNLPQEEPADDKFVWTYSSQDFPMVQENRLQEFKFPEPVLCIGGFLQVELVGRVQRQEMDCLFYICVARVQVMGRALFPAFDIDVLPSGKFQLMYYPEALYQTLQRTSSGEGSGNVRVLSPEEVLWDRVGLLEYLVGGNQPGHLDWVDDDINDDDGDDDDDDVDDDDNDDDDDDDDEDEVLIL